MNERLSLPPTKPQNTDPMHAILITPLPADRCRCRKKAKNILSRPSFITGDSKVETANTNKKGKENTSHLSHTHRTVTHTSFASLKTKNRGQFISSYRLFPSN